MASKSSARILRLLPSCKYVYTIPTSIKKLVCDLCAPIDRYKSRQAKTQCRTETSLKLYFYFRRIIGLFYSRFRYHDSFSDRREAVRHLLSASLQKMAAHPYNPQLDLLALDSGSYTLAGFGCGD